MFAPDAINLDRTDDSEKADEIGPDFVENKDYDDGEDAQTDRPI
jgi:hypothetical protein